MKCFKLRTIFLISRRIGTEHYFGKHKLNYDRINQCGQFQNDPATFLASFVNIKSIRVTEVLVTPGADPA